MVSVTVYEFTVQLPPDALPGYRSSHGQLSWEVEVRCDEFGMDTVERKELELTVGGPGDRSAPPR